MTVKASRRKRSSSRAAANSAPQTLLKFEGKNSTNGIHSAQNSNGSSAKTIKNGSTTSTVDKPWAQIEELYLRLLEEFYEHEDEYKSLALVRMLMPLLRRADPARESIFASECLSLIAEVRGNLPAAIRYRNDEIAKMQRLWQSAKNVEQSDLILKLHSPLDLADRYDLLAILYHDSGQLKQAIQALWKSREICEEHGVKFDSTDLLKEYLQELRGPVKAKKKK